MLYLVEHFYSIQGEGKRVGTPSIFFRFGACNMKCEGFACVQKSARGVEVMGCDTVYAVNKEHFSHTWVSITKTQELLQVLEHYDVPKSVDIVLTGGEPLLNANNPIFIAFLEALDERGHEITFETNATIRVDFEIFPIYKKTHFAMSVKLSNSLEPYAKRIRKEVIHSIAHNARDAFFKFSIDASSINLGLENEIEEISAIAPKVKIYCMPVASSKEELERNTEPLVAFCKAKAYNFSDRLHIRIWDANKGI